VEIVRIKSKPHSQENSMTKVFNGSWISFLVVHSTRKICERKSSLIDYGSSSQTRGRDPFEDRQFPENGRQTMKLRIFSINLTK
jgi:hypothetical protein